VLGEFFFFFFFCRFPGDVDVDAIDNRFKYTPTLLKEILFPSSPRSSSPADAPHPRKRRRIQAQEPTEDVEMVAIGDGEGDTGPPIIPTTTSSTSTARQEHSIGDLTPPLPPPAVRPVILETAKETYLLSPSVLTAQGRVVRAYDIALVLETEVVVEDQEDQVSVEKADERAAADVETKVDEEALSLKTTATKDGSAPSKMVSNIADGPTEPVPLPSPSTHDAAAVETPAPAPPSSPPPSEDQNTDANALHDKPSNGNNTTTTVLIDDEMMVIEEHIAKPQFAAVQVQVLQRGLSVEMFRFAEDGVYVLEGTSVSASASANDGMETEWAILVRNWKWAPRWPSLRERV